MRILLKVLASAAVVCTMTHMANTLEAATRLSLAMPALAEHLRLALAALNTLA